jgi:hypothetical protein
MCANPLAPTPAISSFPSLHAGTWRPALVRLWSAGKNSVTCVAGKNSVTCLCLRQRTSRSFAGNARHAGPATARNTPCASLLKIRFLGWSAVASLDGLQLGAKHEKGVQQTASLPGYRADGRRCYPGARWPPSCAMSRATSCV